MLMPQERHKVCLRQFQIVKTISILHIFQYDALLHSSSMKTNIQVNVIKMSKTFQVTSQRSLSSVIEVVEINFVDY